MQISIASGKGGTGKTTLSLLLAAAAPHFITLVDCDVEEPNCHLFVKPTWQEEPEAITVLLPRVDEERCNGCGRCSTLCLFNAIAMTGQKPLLFDELCHHCGGCLLACPQQAISEQPKNIGTITKGTSLKYPALQLLKGTLDVGVPSGVPLIKQLRLQAAALKGDVLLDSPPGTACAMVSAVKDSDVCLLVTEPTPFGWHDLKLAMNITRLLQVPTGVVINKSDAAEGVEKIEAFCQNRQIPVIAKIPHSLAFAQSYASGSISDEFMKIAQEIWHTLGKMGGEADEGTGCD